MKKSLVFTGLAGGIIALLSCNGDRLAQRNSQEAYENDIPSKSKDVSSQPLQININVGSEELQPKNSENSKEKEKGILAHETKNIETREKDNDNETKKNKNEYPEPPIDLVSTPKSLLIYYQDAWEKKDYPAMYGALHDSVRENVSYEQFLSRLKEDAEGNFGLKKFDFKNKIPSNAYKVKTEIVLRFKNERAQPRRVVAELIETPNGYRILDSGIIPIDLGNL